MASSAAWDERCLAGYCAAGVADQIAPLVVVLRKRHEISPLGEKICQSERGSVTVPGVETFLVEGGPCVAVGGKGEVFEGFAETGWGVCGGHDGGG